MSNTMRGGLGTVWALQAEIRQSKEYIQLIDDYVADLRELLPGDLEEVSLHETMKMWSEKAVQDIATLMAACIDYRNVLIRAYIGDPVSGRPDGVEAIMARYGVKIETSRTAGIEASIGRTD